MFRLCRPLRAPMATGPAREDRSCPSGRCSAGRDVLGWRLRQTVSCCLIRRSLPRACGGRLLISSPGMPFLVCGVPAAVRSACRNDPCTVQYQYRIDIYQSNISWQNNQVQPGIRGGQRGSVSLVSRHVGFCGGSPRILRLLHHCRSQKAGACSHGASRSAGPDTDKKIRQRHVSAPVRPDPDLEVP